EHGLAVVGEDRDVADILERVEVSLWNLDLHLIPDAVRRRPIDRLREATRGRRRGDGLCDVTCCNAEDPGALAIDRHVHRGVVEGLSKLNVTQHRKVYEARAHLLGKI